MATNPAFTEEQQLSNPLLKKFSKGSKKMAEKDNIKSTVKSFESATTTTTQSGANRSNHPLSGHPCYRLGMERLCKNSVNLLDLPGKLDLKPYWKEALVKKSSFEGVEMK